MLILLSELLFEFPELNLILPEQRPLIDIFINTGLILDLLGSRSKLQSGDGLAEALGRGRYHGHHGRLAVASQ